MTENLQGQRGAPYIAVDLDWSGATTPPARVWRNRQKIANFVEDRLGLGIGLIIYGDRLHLDLRRSTWFDDER